MVKSLEKIYFKSVLEAIIIEEKTLNDLFAYNCKYQRITPNGISCLFETTYVYIILKQLLKNKFPLLISWEHSYPGNESSKVDMALLNEDESINSFVEFKIWKSEDGNEIKQDSEKLKHTYSFDKYILAIEYNSENFNDNLAFLRDKLGLKTIESARLLTSYFDWKNRINIQAPLNVYFIKV